MKKPALVITIALMCAQFVYAADPQLDRDLFLAVQFQDAEKVKALIDRGANPSYVEEGRSLLGSAAQSGNLDLVNVLIKAKAELNHVDTVRHTPLMRAIETQFPEIAKALIAAGADVNAKNDRGESTLMIAAISQKPEIVKALIDSGADVKFVTAEGESPALAAAQDGSPESIEILKLLGAAKATMNASNAAYTPLSWAISQGNVDLVKALLNAGADPNVKTASGTIPLLQAISTPDIAAALLDAKADPNVVDDYGTSALYSAVANGTKETVELLFAHGAQVAREKDSGANLLFVAKQYDKQDVFQLLKKHGAVESAS